MKQQFDLFGTGEVREPEVKAQSPSTHDVRGLADEVEMVRRLDMVLGISAPEPLRLARLRARNGLSEAEARLRLERQESEDALLSCATRVIVNVGTEADLVTALEECFGAV